MEHIWENRALALLDKCFATTPTELNEMDWKIELSDNNERIAQHLCAFANYPNGGFLVFGVSDNGVMFNVDGDKANEIVKRISSIARQTLNYTVNIDHATICYSDFNLLFVYIKENVNKPVSIRKDGIMGAYIRSGKSTVKMSEEEVRNMLGANSGLNFEKKISRGSFSGDEVLSKLDYTTLFKLLDKPIPNRHSVLHTLAEEEFIIKSELSNTYNITNLGAIVLSTNLSEEGFLKTKRVRVIQFKGTNKLDTIKDQTGNYGYALALPKLEDYIMAALPKNEIIKTAIRQELPLYPKIAIREFVANALIHQDFTVSGANVTIEIYSDRLEIINPGVPLIDIDRIIDTPPRARNYALSEIMRRLGMCEKRGSGVQRSLVEIESYQLPAPKFLKGENYTKVILYAPIKYQDMGDEDRIRACYQHCCLRYIGGIKVNNESVRERFNISKNNYTMATKILNDTMQARWIKIEDPNSESLKHRTYIPFWA